MSHTNNTPNFNLPQFLGSDVPSWISDINPAFSAIDTAMQANKTTASDADAKAESASSTASKASSVAQNAITGINQVNNDIAGWTDISSGFTLANTSLFNTFSISAYYNKKLNLLSMYGNIATVNGAAWNVNNVGILNTPLRPSSKRNLLCNFFIDGVYQNPAGSFFQCIPCSLSTNGLLSDAGFGVLPRYNNASTGAIRFSFVISTYGWGLDIDN